MKCISKTVDIITPLPLNVMSDDHCDSPTNSLSGKAGSPTKGGLMHKYKLPLLASQTTCFYFFITCNIFKTTQNFALKFSESI